MDARPRLVLICRTHLRGDKATRLARYWRWCVAALGRACISLRRVCSSTPLHPGSLQWSRAIDGERIAGGRCIGDPRRHEGPCAFVREVRPRLRPCGFAPCHCPPANHSASFPVCERAVDAEDPAAISIAGSSAVAQGAAMLSRCVARRRRHLALSRMLLQRPGTTSGERTYAPPIGDAAFESRLPPRRKRQ